MIYRVYVEKKDDHKAKAVMYDTQNLFGVKLKGVRTFLRYDVEGLTEDEFKTALGTVFSEPPVDDIYLENLPSVKGDVFAVSYLPGQYDQRADSCAQCIQLMTMKERPLVSCATIFVVDGADESSLKKIKNHLINPVEAHEIGLEKPKSLQMETGKPEDVPVLKGFINMPDEDIIKLHKKYSLAMSEEDLLFVRDYFKSELRDPYETEIKVIDTYWSDHCRHTTFNAELENIEIISSNPHIADALERYKSIFSTLYKGRTDKYVSLMDLATIATKYNKKQGLIPDLDESEEINACSINKDVTIDGAVVPYTIMFKNETHNHPTEIEPFGGAATCLGGAIRDPLAGRAYVIEGMRVTGAADPREDVEKTIPGKLPQRVLTKTAAQGFSSYGNQIGLATGGVYEVYSEGYKAKRLETGYVVGVAPTENIYREAPKEGDIIILLGGETGRDGCGGATGSSKAHDKNSVQTCGAEVQKGNPLEERKLQRLILNPKVTKMIKRCNDFGAGGVSVAIGELAPGLVIDLDKVPKKYEGLTGTELAISESQERMAVVISPEDKDEFISLAAAENLEATAVAVVTDTGCMKMMHSGREIVNIKRSFLDTNGVKQRADVLIFDNASFEESFSSYEEELESSLTSLENACQKGLGEMFDSTIGTKSVYMPYGGKYQLTPAPYMAAKVSSGDTKDCVISAYGLESELLTKSPYTGAMYSIISSVSKLVSAGAKLEDIRLTLQEFFLRLGSDAKRWGQPAEALLGAMTAQLNLGLSALGGKDSMSGTYENIDVPPTLISFAIAPAKTDRLLSNVLKGGEKVYLVHIKKDEYLYPDYEYLKHMYSYVHDLCQSGQISFSQPVDSCGVIISLIKSLLGNMSGFEFENIPVCTLFSHNFIGDILIGSDKELPEIKGLDITYLGKACKNEIKYNGHKIDITKCAKALYGTLSDVFPVTSGVAEKNYEDYYYDAKSAYKPKTKLVHPKVFIPAFPGTNCEIDTANAFIRAGAAVETVVIRNRSAQDISDSVEDVCKAIKSSQLICFPGGFSGGDEPDGSGKFICAVFKNPKIKDCVLELLNNRDGLILGICNGFQALVKLGLVPYGEILDLNEGSPTLTFNDISRHVSTLVDIKVNSILSPWLNACKTGEVYKVPVSHGEGKFIAGEKDLQNLIKNGQIATRYVDLNGIPTSKSPYNPNGSCLAIEGITSPDGRVYGKMGHSERYVPGLYKNIDGNFDMKIFSSGVGYFA